MYAIDVKALLTDDLSGLGIEEEHAIMNAVESVYELGGVDRTTADRIERRLGYTVQGRGCWNCLWNGFCVSGCHWVTNSQHEPFCEDGTPGATTCGECQFTRCPGHPSGIYASEMQDAAIAQAEPFEDWMPPMMCQDR